jgi:hypothetical protein
MDAINMYDQCIVSVGLIQWCEASYFLTSKLLGAVLDSNPDLITPLQPALTATRAQFTKGSDGKWKFSTSSGVVDERPEQTSLFFLHSNGSIGSWDDASKTRAKLWASCFANFLLQDNAISVQVPYTAIRLKSFATTSAQSILWDGSPDDGLVGATRAAFLSFAANLPAVASTQLVKAAATSSAQKWSQDWCVDILRGLTFGPNISIYPGRYEAIRPVMESLYGVNLPDFASDLQSWKSNMQSTQSGSPDFTNPVDVQQLLIDLGYDIGPKGADGNIGAKTMDAIGTFQGMNGLLDTRIIDSDTRNKMVEAWQKIHP